MSCAKPWKYLLATDDDGGLIVLETASRRQATALAAHTGAIGAGRTDVAARGLAGGIAWTIRSTDGVLLGATQIYSGTILAASPRGDLLAVTIPYKMTLWDARTGASVQTLEGEAEELLWIGNWRGSFCAAVHTANFSPTHRLTAHAATGPINGFRR